MQQGRLAGRYPAAAAMVIFALVPYLALTAALSPLSPMILHDLHTTPQTLSTGLGMANAGYALGTILAVALAQHLPQRRMQVIYCVALMVGAFLAATAHSAGVFITGLVLMGLCTSLLLIASAPALALGFGPDKLGPTAMVMSMGIFGAVALGPTFGGLQAHYHHWRPLFYVIAAITVVAVLLSLLTFEDAPPADTSAPWDVPALLLAAIGSTAAFWGSSQLTSHSFGDPLTWIPLLSGLALIVMLIVHEVRSPRPLLTIKTMLTRTIPVAGVIVALFAAAASISAIDLTSSALSGRYDALHVGLLYLPELGGAVLTAVALGLLLRRRQLQLLPVAGMLFLIAGILVFRIDVPSSQAMTLLGSGLTGVGLGATVAPALFIAGLSLPAANLQRVFALIELLRAVAAFMIAPIFIHVADTASGGPIAGTKTALWIGLALAGGGLVIGLVVYLLGGSRPVAADLILFTEGTSEAWPSPRLFARLRGNTARDEGSVDSVPRAGSTERAVGSPALDVPAGVTVFGFDGSPQSRTAITQAATVLRPGSDVLVVTVWQPVDVGFTPVTGDHFDADDVIAVRAAAASTAAEGARLAGEAGFTAYSRAVESSPIWKGVVDTADACDAALIVLGSHSRRAGARGMVGSIAGDISTHTRRPVLLIRDAAHREALVDA